MFCLPVSRPWSVANILAGPALLILAISARGDEPPLKEHAPQAASIEDLVREVQELRQDVKRLQESIDRLTPSPDTPSRADGAAPAAATSKPPQSNWLQDAMTRAMYRVVDIYLRSTQRPWQRPAPLAPLESPRPAAVVNDPENPPEFIMVLDPTVEKLMKEAAARGETLKLNGPYIKIPNPARAARPETVPAKQDESRR